MSTLALRKRLVAIARKDVGQKEVSRNRSPAIQKFWPATSYPEGYNTKVAPYYGRAPYCAAALAYWVQQWLKDPEVLKALGKTPSQAEAWRCKSAGAYAWQDWAEKKGLLVMSDSQSHILHTADIVVYDFSHIGLITNDYKKRIVAIEANTGPPTGSQRDGDGIYEKDRPREIARAFIRLLP